jgi:hypothetical protein
MEFQWKIGILPVDNYMVHVIKYGQSNQKQFHNRIRGYTSGKHCCSCPFLVYYVEALDM